MDRQALIEEFCISESETLYGNVRKRRSVLIQIQKDIDFNLGLYGHFRDLNLTQEQQRYLDRKLAPLFVVPILFCSAIDLMARVKHKGAPRGQNGAIFKDSAQTFFGLSTEMAALMWEFRNSLSHQYSIQTFTISRSGSSNVIEIHSNDRRVIFVRAMRGALRTAIGNLRTLLEQESQEDFSESAQIIEDHGFTYYLTI